MTAPQTTTSLVQTGRRWIMIAIALITISLSAPSAVADHMGNHERPLEASAPMAATCGHEAHEDEAVSSADLDTNSLPTPWQPGRSLQIP
jgi:hypothetical protein